MMAIAIVSPCESFFFSSSVMFVFKCLLVWPNPALCNLRSVVTEERLFVSGWNAFNLLSTWSGVIVEEQDKAQVRFREGSKME